MPESTRQQGWFDVETIAPGVTMIAEMGHEEQVHSYIIEGERDAAVLDTGMGVGDFYGLVRSLTDLDPIVIQSHAHWDHIGASARFDRILIHPAEVDGLARGYPNPRLREAFPDHALNPAIPLPADFNLLTASIPGATPTGFLEPGAKIDLGGRELEVYHTPGHSPAGITILDRASRLLFPADAINFGRIYLFGDQADLAAYQQTIDLLADLADQVDLMYPSHYAVPLQPEDVRKAQALFAEVIAGRVPEETREREAVELHHFEDFTFILDQGATREER